MPNYNPNATETLGVEVLPRDSGYGTINTDGAGFAMDLRSLAAETINKVQLWIDRVDVAGTFVVDVYPKSVLPDLGQITETVYSMNEDVTVTNVTGSPVNGAGLRYQNIDEALETWEDSADYIRPTTDGVTFLYEGRVASAAFSGRPIYVKLRVALDINNGHNVASSLFNIGFNIGGTNWFHTSSDSHNVSTYVGREEVIVEATWYRNPSNQLPWTVADIQSFDSTNELAVQMVAQGWWSFAPFTTEMVAAMDLVVGSVPELRVATASATLAVTGAESWKDFALTAIGGGNWSKANATTYTYVLRRSSKTGSITWQGINLNEVSPVGYAAGFSVTLSSGKPQTLTDQLRWYGLMVVTTAPDDSNDSQVYGAVVEEAINSGVTTTTEFSNAAAKSYGIITLQLKYTGSINQSLSIKIKRRSDNVQMGSTVTVTKADVDALPDIGGGWKKLKVSMGTPASLAASIQYFWEFTSTATVGSWLVANLWTMGQDARSFGGLTDRATRAGTESNSYDIAATLGTVPSTPTNWAVALTNQAIPSDSSEGTVDAVQYANCTWTATSLAALFSYYEIQRTEDGGTTWVTIALLTTEATVAFKDFEGAKTKLCGYRLRVQRIDGAFSAWTSTQSVTPARLASDVWSFVSNSNQGVLNVVFKKLEGGTYVFPEAEEVQYHAVFGHDFYQVLQPEENRGVQVEISVLVSSLRSYNQGSNVLGWPVYNRLRELCRAGLDYICVHDPWNNRTLASVLVPEAPLGGSMPWLALIRITQIADEFSTEVV